MQEFILTPNEKQILDTLWDQGQPLTRGQIIEFCTQKTWKPSSIHILLNALLDKGAIEVAGFGRYNKQYGRTYQPTLSKDDYESMDLALRFKEMDSNITSIPKMFSFLVKDQVLSKEDMDELYALIDKVRYEES